MPILDERIRDNPVLKIAQYLSGAVKPTSPHYIEGVKPGMVYSTKTHQFWLEGFLATLLTMQPCWVDTDRGSNFAIDTKIPEIVNDWKRRPKFKFPFPSKRSITQAYMFCVWDVIGMTEYNLLLYRTDDPLNSAQVFWDFFLNRGEQMFHLKPKFVPGNRKFNSQDHWDWEIPSILK